MLIQGKVSFLRRKVALARDCAQALLGCFVYDRLCLFKACFTAGLMQDNSPYLTGVRKWPLERLRAHDVFAMIKKATLVLAAASLRCHVLYCAEARLHSIFIYASFMSCAKG